MSTSSWGILVAGRFRIPVLAAGFSRSVPDQEVKCHLVQFSFLSLVTSIFSFSVPTEDDEQAIKGDVKDTEADAESPLPGCSAENRVESSEEEEMEEDEEEDEDNSEDVLDTREKFLIFTMGSRTYTPHQIGLKRILPFTFCRRIDVGPSLAERVAIRRQVQEAQREAQALGVPL